MSGCGNFRTGFHKELCDMPASGKKRVFCFDPFGYYSKAFSASESPE